MFTAQGDCYRMLRSIKERKKLDMCVSLCVSLCVYYTVMSFSNWAVERQKLYVVQIENHFVKDVLLNYYIALGILHQSLTLILITFT